MATFIERMAALEDGLDDLVQWKAYVDEELLNIRQRVIVVEIQSPDEVERIYGITLSPGASDDDRLDEIAKAAQLEIPDETPED